MKMKIIQGDLIKLAQNGQFGLIIHGCNCLNTMGRGIAKSIRQNFPAAYQADQATTKGDRRKLGTFSSAVVTNKIGTDLIVINAYTQYNYSYKGKGVLADYDAIRSIMREIAVQFPDKRIGYPMIGAGLAKGDWAIISEIIETELQGLDHTLVEYKP